MEQTQKILDKMMARSWLFGTQDKMNWQQTKGDTDHIYTPWWGTGGNNQGREDNQTGRKNTRGRDKLTETRVNVQSKNSKPQDNIATIQLNTTSFLGHDSMCK